MALGGPTGVGSTLLFAQLRHEGAPPAQVIRTRAIVSFAWVIGPPLATLIAGASGTPAVLLLLAGIGLVNVVTALLLLRRSIPDRKCTRLNSSHVSISYA